MIEEIYSIYKRSSGVCTDSRTVKSNSVYFALKGPNFNGNKFALDALNKGASFAIVDEDHNNTSNPFILQVPDALKALQDLASLHRSRLKIPVLALSGSNGKTTTKELIASVLSTTYNTLSTSGNLNNHIGVPLTLLSITEEHEIAIIEMGANHRGEINSLCEIANPEYGLLTNIGLAHLEGFGGEEGVYLGKKELIDYLATNDGKFFANLDDPKIMRAVQTSPVVTYGKHSDAFFSGNPGLVKGYLQVTWSRKNLKQEFQVQTRLTGTYNFSNVMAAIAVGRFFGVTDKKINKAIASYVPKNNRSQLEETTSGNTLILDHYNANPSSMHAALDNMEAIDHTHKIAILGDMLEGGPGTKIEHQKILERIINSDVESAILVGPIFGSFKQHPKVKMFPSADVAREFLSENPPKKSLVLVKGSRGTRLEKLIDLL